MGKHGSKHQQQPKKRQQVDNQEWEAVLKEAKVDAVHSILITPPQKLNLALVALFMPSLPVVTFYSSIMFELSLGQYAPQFVGVSVIAGLLLYYTYLQVANLKEEKLIKQRDLMPSGNLSKKDKEAWQATLYSSTTMESLSYALFVCNALYLAAFLYLAFSASPKYGIVAGTNHLLSTLLPAVLLAARPSFFVW